jgi:hypothetical protein
MKNGQPWWTSWVAMAKLASNLKRAELSIGIAPTLALPMILNLLRCLEAIVEIMERLLAWDRMAIGGLLLSLYRFQLRPGGGG